MNPDVPADFLRHLTRVWLAKIKLAKTAKRPFDDVRDQCMTFFAGPVGTIWSQDFQQKFFGTTIPVRFQLSVNKAFELVALFGPVIYNRNPVRSVNAYQPIELEPEVFVDPSDPSSQMYYQQLVAQQQREHAVNKLRCQLCEAYLNYTPNEQPEGGLKQAAEDALTEALITGLGLLWPERYEMPGSNRKLTGCFFDSNRNLLVDPDSRRMDFGHAKWVARRHVDPIWQVERRFNLPRGALKGHAKLESADATARRQQTEHGNLEHSKGHTFDLMTWWEVWSIGGVGGRLMGMDPSFNKTWDQYVGDYAYLALAPGVEWPLNCPLEWLRTAYPEEVQRKFQWPVPFWMDRRWPFAALAFYRHPRMAWPVSPLGPAIGELSFLNLMFSRTAEHIWESTRQFLAVAQAYKDEIEKVMKRGENLACFGVKGGKSIKELVQFLEYPNISTDVWQIMTAVMEMFDKRVGLTELWYALNPGGAASRTATDIQAKTEKAAIRPDHMAGKAEDWLSEVSAMEKLCAYWEGVSSQDVYPLLGTVGASLWDQFFMGADPEVVAREMDAQVVAGTAKRRNKQVELASISEIYQPLSQQLATYAQITTDSRPLNELNDKLFDAMSYDGAGLQMGPWMPPPQPSPEKQEGERREEEHDQEMRHREESHELEMTQREDEMAQRAAESRQKMRLEAQKAQVQNRLARLKSNGRAA